MALHRVMGLPPAYGDAVAQAVLACVRGDDPLTRAIGFWAIQFFQRRGTVLGSQPPAPLGVLPNQGIDPCPPLRFKLGRLADHPTRSRAKCRAHPHSGNHSGNRTGWAVDARHRQRLAGLEAVGIAVVCRATGANAQPFVHGIASELAVASHIGPWLTAACRIAARIRVTLHPRSNLVRGGHGTLPLELAVRGRHVSRDVVAAGPNHHQWKCHAASLPWGTFCWVPTVYLPHILGHGILDSM